MLPCNDPCTLKGKLARRFRDERRAWERTFRSTFRLFSTERDRYQY